MARKAKIGLVALAAIGAGVLAVWYFAPDGRTAEQRVLDNIAEIQAAVNAKSVSGCMEHVSEEYEDSMNENKRALMRLLTAGLRERGTIRCVVLADAPVIEGSGATVNLRVEFSIAYGGGKVNREGPFPVRTTWAKEKARWRLVKAEGYMTAQNAYEFMN